MISAGVRPVRIVRIVREVRGETRDLESSSNSQWGMYPSPRWGLNVVWIVYQGMNPLAMIRRPVGAHYALVVDEDYVLYCNTPDAH